MIWIGTSGWVYRDWAGRFYPPALPAGAWLPFYAAEFPTVEINRSYYRLPSREVFAGWAAQVPPAPAFRFAVKASRFLTHMKKLREPEEPLRRLTEAAGGLGDHLGPILYQLPPRWRADPARLAAFVGLLPAAMPAAFEFRDPSWHQPAVFDLLEAGRCTLAIGVWGRNPPPVEAPRVGPFAYVRFHHGEQGWGFAEAELAPWVPRLAGEAQAGRDVYVYFNNDPGGNAIVDARRLRAMLIAAGAPVAAGGGPGRPGHDPSGREG